MNKQRNLMVCICLLVFSNFAFGNSPVSGTAILEIGSYSANRIFVKTGTNGSVVNPAGCTAQTFGLEKSDENFEEMYAALLVAMVNSGTVNLIISSTQCINGAYPKIIYVGVMP